MRHRSLARHCGGVKGKPTPETDSTAIAMGFAVGRLLDEPRQESRRGRRLGALGAIAGVQGRFLREGLATGVAAPHTAR